MAVDRKDLPRKGASDASAMSGIRLGLVEFESPPRKGRAGRPVPTTKTGMLWGRVSRPAPEGFASCRGKVSVFMPVGARRTRELLFHR